MFDRKKLETWRTSRGLNKAQMGRLVGVHESTICDWEAGRYAPKQERQEEIKRAMQEYDANPIQPNQTWAEMVRHCKGCIYLGDNVKTCDYYLLTGTRRPCKPGKGCTVKLRAKRGMARPFTQQTIEIEGIQNDRTPGKNDSGNGGEPA